MAPFATVTFQFPVLLKRCGSPDGHCDRPRDRIEDLFDVPGAYGSHEGETSNFNTRESFLDAWDKPVETGTTGDDVVNQRDGLGCTTVRVPVTTAGREILPNCDRRNDSAHALASLCWNGMVQRLLAGEEAR